MKHRPGPVFICGMAKLVAGTLRLRVIGEERFEAMRRESGKGAILATWHGRTFVPITYFRGRGYWSMISTSRDGEMQHRVFQRFGFHTVRGSTSARGAVQATLTLVKQLREGAVLAQTPDGPRGPSRQAHPGTVYLAMKSGCPIVPVGVSVWPRKLLNAWDRYLVPMPFARAVLIFGDPIYIPADAKSEQEQQHWASCVETAINDVEAEAERLVLPSARPSPARDEG